MAQIEINDKKIEAQDGEMIIAAADRNGIHIPRFCYHKKLSIAANCRMCLVEVEGSRKTLPACATPVADGMKVYTKSKAAQESQRIVMEFLLINHPLDCPICDQGGECELQDLSMGYGEGQSHYIERKRSIEDKDIGPLVATELTRCIQCTRCTRFGEEIAGMPELGVIKRGEKAEISTFLHGAMRSEMSGNVIDICPVGALTNKPFRFQARTWEMRQHEAIAPHDCMGSNMYVHTRGWQYTPVRNVMRTVPRDNESINEVWLSDRDRYSYEGINSQERLFKPMIKRDGKWSQTDWPTALNFVADALMGIKDNKRGSQIGAIASPNCTVEEHYLLQKLMRGFGVENIDHRIRQTDFSDQEHLGAWPQLGCDIAQLENLDAALLIGSDIRREQPIACTRLRKITLKNKPIFAINPIDYEFNFSVAEKIIAADDQFVQAVAEIAAALSELSDHKLSAQWEKLLKVIKPSKQATTIAKQLMQAKKAAIILGAYGNYFPQSATLRALVKLIAELSDASVGVLTAGSNEAGACLAGCLPHRLPGAEPVKAAGLNAESMFEKSLAAYLLMNVEPEYDCVNSQMVVSALKKANLVTMITPFISDQMRDYADVLLPMTPFTENEGHIVNANVSWQKNKIINLPQGEARPAWKVLRVLGNLLTINGFDFATVDEVTDELKQILIEVKESDVKEFVPKIFLPSKPAA